MSSAEPSMMAVVSPTRVAAPCRLEDTATPMMKGTGFVLSFLQISSATGAIISTVATLSMKAEIIPANRAIATAAARMLLTRSITRSARRAGILLSMKSATRPIVPAIIRITFRSMEGSTFPRGSMPVAMKTSAEPSAM